MPVQPSKDLLNDSLKETVFIRNNQPLFRQLAKETHFNLNEVEALSLIHFIVCNERGPMTRIPFRDILHAGFDYTENVRHLLVDRVFSVMDKQNLSQLNVEQWIKGLSTILRGTIDERINFAYNVYDLMMNGKIKKEQVFPSMKGCLINMGNMGPDEDLDETVKDMIELMFKTLDVDRDGTISKSDFKKAVMKNNLLLLECMGPVFPSRDFRNAFFTTFTNNIGDF